MISQLTHLLEDFLEEMVHHGQGLEERRLEEMVKVVPEIRKQDHHEQALKADKGNP